MSHKSKDNFLLIGELQKACRGAADWCMTLWDDHIKKSVWACVCMHLKLKKNISIKFVVLLYTTSLYKYLYISHQSWFMNEDRCLRVAAEFGVRVTGVFSQQRVLPAEGGLQGWSWADGCQHCAERCGPAAETLSAHLASSGNESIRWSIDVSPAHRCFSSSVKTNRWSRRWLRRDSVILLVCFRNHMTRGWPHTEASNHWLTHHCNLITFTDRLWHTYWSV